MGVLWCSKAGRGSVCGGCHHPGAPLREHLCGCFARELSIVACAFQANVQSAMFLTGGGFSLELFGLWIYLVLQILSQQTILAGLSVVLRSHAHGPLSRCQPEMVSCCLLTHVDFSLCSMPRVIRRAWKTETLSTLDECISGKPLKFFQVRTLLLPRSQAGEFQCGLALGQEALEDPSPCGDFWKHRDVLCELRLDRADKVTAQSLSCLFAALSRV